MGPRTSSPNRPTAEQIIEMQNETLKSLNNEKEAETPNGMFITSANIQNLTLVIINVSSVVEF